MRNIIHVVASIVTVGLVALASSFISAQTPATREKGTYVWFGELISLDAASKTVTVRASTRDAVAGYVDRFKPGDKIMMVWDVVSTLDADTLIYLVSYETMKNSKLDDGYILPAEFVSADKAAKTVTFKAAVPDNVVQALTSVPPGRWLKVTAPMSQPNERASVGAVEVSASRPSPTPRPRPQEKPEVTAQVTKVTTPEEYVNAMKAVSAAFGAANKAIQSGAAADAKAPLANARSTMVAVQAFWVEKKKDDPATIAKDSVAKMDALEKTLSGSDGAAIAGAAKEVTGTCGACHSKYREQDPATKTYKIKAGTL